jgi:methionine-rich copper-binding protein CopC
MLIHRLGASLGLALALFALAPQLAAGHARYDRSDPAGESVVATAPAELRVWFTEELRTQGSSLEVVDATGNRVDRGDSRVDLNDPDRKLMRISLGTLPDGVYTVRWRSASQDGHELDGTFRFGVGASLTLPPADAAGHGGEQHGH